MTCDELVICPGLTPLLAPKSATRGTVGWMDVYFYRKHANIGKLAQCFVIDCNYFLSPWSFADDPHSATFEIRPPPKKKLHSRHRETNSALQKNVSAHIHAVKCGPDVRALPS